MSSPNGSGTETTTVIQVLLEKLRIVGKIGTICRELKPKQKLLAQAELEALTTGVNFRDRMLKNEVNNLLDKETRMWI